jgi:hypothetical protein
LTGQTYTTLELDAFVYAKKLATQILFHCSDNSGSGTILKLDSKLSAVQLCEAYLPDKGGGGVNGRILSVIPGNPSDVMAFYFDSASRFKTSTSKRSSRQNILSKPNPHAELVRRVKYTTAKGISGKEWVTYEYWMKLPDGVFALIAFPADTGLRLHHNPTLVRAESRQYFIFSPTVNGSTRVEFYYHVNLKGSILHPITRDLSQRYFVDLSVEAALWFQDSRLHTSCYLGQLDGVNMGEMLLHRVKRVKASSGWKTKVAKAEQEIDTFLERNMVCSNFKGRFPWFKVFLKTIIRNDSGRRRTTSLP